MLDDNPDRKETLNGQERMYRSISGQVPDRVPCLPKIWIDLACKITGNDYREAIQDPFTILSTLAESYRMVGADGFRQFHFPARNLVEKEGRMFEVSGARDIVGEVDLYGGLITQLENPEYFDCQDPRFMAYNHYWSSRKPLIRDLKTAKKMVVPPKSFYKEDGCGERQRRIMDRYGEEMAVIGDCDTGTMAFLVTMRGMEQALLDLMLEPELVHAIMEKGASYCIEKGKFNIDMGIKILRLNDSVGNMNVISPAQWDDFVFPHFRTIVQELHHYDPSVRIYCHICGNVMPVLERLVETGLDCIGPLDPLGGVDPLIVRNIVGNRVSLLGGVDTLSFINHTAEAVRDEAKQCILSAGARGGYILSTGCVLPRDSKIENIRALKEAALKYGFYRNDTLATDAEDELN